MLLILEIKKQMLQIMHLIVIIKGDAGNGVGIMPNLLRLRVIFIIRVMENGVSHQLKMSVKQEMIVREKQHALIIAKLDGDEINISIINLLFLKLFSI
jgi:hypothetical protein